MHRLLPIALVFAVFAASAALALPPRPPKPTELLLRTRTVDAAAKQSAAPSRHGRHLIIQYDPSRRADALAALRRQGVRVLEAVPRNAVSAWVPAGVDARKAAGVRWVGTLEARDKVSLPPGELASEMSVLVDVFPDVTRAAAVAAIRRAGGREIPNRYLRATTLHVEIAARDLAALSAQDEISFVYAASDAIKAGRPVVSCTGALTQNLFAPNYSYTDDGWDGPGLGPASLTYFFENDTPDLVNEENEVVRALWTWSQYAQI
ncbi:MAG: hypothetical protein FJ091_02550 [Deltaproteobacteria bacterium]|nr:hypothetical protein [Deltaproteobacteria bacterium]